MKLILREEIDHLGKRGDVVNVAKGYARNYLLPKRLAMEVNDNNLRRIEKEKKIYLARMAQEKEAAEGLAGQLSSVRLSFRRKVHGDGEELYGSVTVTDIAEALEAKGYELEKKKIGVVEPFKSLGEFPVGIKLHPEVTVEIQLTIEKEEE